MTILGKEFRDNSIIGGLLCLEEMEQDHLPDEGNEVVGWVAIAPVSDPQVTVSVQTAARKYPTNKEHPVTT